MTQLPSPASVAVFHDESGDFGHGEWVFIGLLWVRREDIGDLATELQSLRGSYAGEVHFYRFPRNFGGSYGGAARTAQVWFERWRADWARRTWFNALAINRRHLKYDHAWFGRPQQAYDHFTAVALQVGLGAFFQECDTVALAVYSDERSGRANNAPDAASGSDTLSAALQRALLDAATPESSTPPLAPPEVPVAYLSCQSRDGLFSPEQELLQLTDLLVGAVSTAVAPRSRAPTKLWFAREMAKVMEDVRQPPRPQSFGLHSRFLVSYFPDYAGRLYNDGPIHLWDI